ncbi:MAG TPA: DNA repair protein RecN [Planctomycetes bacterium]|nr:DNA repair protein RecN [Planctomycetota bacterium]
MLDQITIRNLALLEEASLSPSAALTVISGETGGGKSLLVLALKLLRGEKGKAGYVRHGARAATIDGVFLLAQGERSEKVRELYEEVLGIPPEKDRLVVSRILDSKGRSKARIDGRPVTLKNLQAFGELLIEIHGQGANRSLMRSETQTELLDTFAGLREVRMKFVSLLRSLRELNRRWKEACKRGREKRERVEFLRFCLGEIESFAPEEGEYLELKEEAGLLQHQDRLRESLSRSWARLYEGGEMEGGQQATLLEEVEGIAGETELLSEIDPKLEEGVRILKEAAVLLEEGARELRDGLGRLEFDPDRKDWVDERLAGYERLLDRFGPGEEELFHSRERMRVELQQLEDPDEGEAALARRFSMEAKRVEQLGKQLTIARKKAAKKLSRLLVGELKDLEMERARVEIRVLEFTGGELLSRATELGLSWVEVYLAPNPGEPMSPLSETASGGEVARVMLALKKILADADCVPVLVFDEVDAEIGGRLGLQIGSKLAWVAKKHQVFCVTHLPQIAAFAEMHVLVRKMVSERGDGERTSSSVIALGEQDRVLELASMQVGKKALDEASLEEARRLLRLARAWPQGAVDGGSKKTSLKEGEDQKAEN